MAANEHRLVLLDAGPLIHLDELGELPLFGLFEEVLIPREVWQECLQHRPQVELKSVPHATLLDDAPAPSNRLAEEIQRANLGRGESAALAWLEKFGQGTLASDDLAARRVATYSGHPVVGTLGILVESVVVGLRSKLHVEQLVLNLRSRSSLHVSDALIARVVASLATLPSR